MKKLIQITVLAFLTLGTSMVAAQSSPKEYLGLPGDNFNLYAVMNLFQSSETLEAFERKLNDPEQMVNNLDLNNDNYVDYIMVLDYAEDDLHNIVLRVALNEHDYQDVAVIVVEKFPNGAVQIQLIGDEALYGANYIVEPVYAETPNPGYRGNSVYIAETNYGGHVVSTTFYEVSQWPIVIYVYSPYYRPWRSAWRWGYYPSYWNPWHPHYWHYYYGYHSHWHPHYYAHYRHCRHYRSSRYQTVYYSRVRRTSSTVVVNVNNGRYRDTYTRPETRSAGEKIASQRVSERKRASTGTASVNSTTRKQDRTKVDNTTRVSNRNSGGSTVTTPIRRIDNSRRTNTTQSKRVNSRNASNNKSSDVHSGNTSNRRETSGNSVRQSTRQSNTTTTARPSTQRTSSREVNKSSSSSNKGSSPSVSRSNRSSSSSSAQQAKPSQSSRSSAKASSSTSSSSKGSATKSESKSNSKNSTNSRTRNR